MQPPLSRNIYSGYVCLSNDFKFSFNYGVFIENNIFHKNFHICINIFVF